MLLVLGTATRWVTCQEDPDVCNKYFNFPTEKDVSVLSGKWVTLGSTRRVFPCNTIVGTTKSNRVIELEESWMVPGIVGVWRQRATSDLTSHGNHIDVTRSALDGVLTSGKLAVGRHGNNLILVQCTYFPWSPLFPMAAVTVLSRDVPSDAASRAREILQRFRIPSSIPSFSTVKHEGCDTLRTTNPRLGSSSSQLLIRNDRPALNAQRTRGWNIQDSPDRNVLF